MFSIGVILFQRCLCIQASGIDRGVLFSFQFEKQLYEFVW